MRDKDFELCAGCRQYRVPKYGVIRKHKIRVVGILVDYKLCRECDDEYRSGEESVESLRKQISDNVEEFVLTQAFARQLADRRAFAPCGKQST